MSCIMVRGSYVVYAPRVSLLSRRCPSQAVVNSPYEASLGRQLYNYGVQPSQTMTGGVGHGARNPKSALDLRLSLIGRSRAAGCHSQHASLHK